MAMKADDAHTIHFETTRFGDGSTELRVLIRATDGSPQAIASSLLDRRTRDELVEVLQGARLTAGVLAEGSASSGWVYGPAPRGVRLLVTTRAPGGAPPRICVATLPPDHDDDHGHHWFSEGRRIHGVIAWMFLPPEAQELETKEPA